MKSGSSDAAQFARLARRWIRLKWPRTFAICFCGVAGTLLPAAYGGLAGVRDPVVPDEFSYVLAADTFALGRLTNPSPQLGEFFESAHILVEPSYCSKYPPGQGLMLAVGQVLFGRPIWGVWLSCGLFAVALCWMLQAWTSTPWAIATTALAIATCGVSSYWAQSYWGGMVAASGGALLFGSLRRTLRAPGVRPGILMGLGVVILANTRPLEGALSCGVAGVPLVVWFFRNRQASLSAKITRWLFPFTAVLMIGVAWMACYNRALTGSWLCTPYTLHQNQYFHQGVFRFSSLRPPERAPAPRVAAFYELHEHPPQRGLQLLSQSLQSFYGSLGEFLDWTLGMTVENTTGSPYTRLWLLAFVATVTLWDLWAWFCIAGVCLVLFGGAFVWWWYPHYAAPVYPLAIAVLAISLRRANAGSHPLRAARRTAPPFVAAMAALFVVILFVPQVSRFAQKTVGQRAAATSPRGTVIQYLARQPGKHLVFVDYPPHDDWVYNGADLGSSIIFAHDLGAAKNSRLIAVNHDRRLWIAHVSGSGWHLEPYR